MPKLNTTVKAVRLDNAILDELESRLNGRSFNSWLNEMIAESLNEKKSSSSEGKPEKIPAELENIEGMVMFSGLTMKQFWDDIAKKLEDGVLMFSSTGTEVSISPWVDRFADVCRDKGLNVEEVAERAIGALQRGLL